MDVDVNESTGHINISAKFQSCRETAIQGAVRRYDFYLIFSSDSLTTKIVPYDHLNRKLKVRS